MKIRYLTSLIFCVYTTCSLFAADARIPQESIKIVLKRSRATFGPEGDPHAIAHASKVLKFKECSPHRGLDGSSSKIVQARKEKYLDAKARKMAEIKEHSDIMPLVSELCDAYGPQNIWVVWDIDDCVTYPLHPACLPISYVHKFGSVLEEMTAPLTPVQSSIVWNLKYRDSANALTDENIPSILSRLKEMGISTLGLTASMAGPVKDKEDNQHQARYQKLKELGIEFHFNPLKDLDEVGFEELPRFHASHPIYYKGIAFSQLSVLYGSATKGEFLEALIEKLGVTPRAVIMIDDSERNLNHVCHDLSKKGVDVYTFKFRSDKVHEKHEITEAEYRSYISALIDKAKIATEEREPDAVASGRT